MTKKQAGMLAIYEQSTLYQLSDCYARPSDAKIRAYEYCMYLCRKYNGDNPKICSYNTFGFTFAFTFTMEGKKYLRYETPQNSYTFEIETEGGDS